MESGLPPVRGVFRFLDDLRAHGPSLWEDQTSYLRRQAPGVRRVPLGAPPDRVQVRSEFKSTPLMIDTPRAPNVCARALQAYRLPSASCLPPASTSPPGQPRVRVIHPSFVASSPFCPPKMAPSPTASADKIDKASARRTQRVVLRPLPPLVFQSPTSRLTIQLSMSNPMASKIASRIAPLSNEGWPSSTCGFFLCHRERV